MQSAYENNKLYWLNKMDQANDPDEYVNLSLFIYLRLRAIHSEVNVLE